MKKSLRSSFLAAVAAIAVTGCTSYEIDTPDNPPEPVVGNEVSTNVIYQANPRFFAQNECLKALDAQLPRIADMGCDIVWIMPIFEPGELKSIGSPYCIRDFKAINPKYGTMADLKTLIANAHSKGVKVMLDWVANHTSWDNPWIKDHPERYRKDANGNITAANGWSDVAQLDFNNPGTRDAMIDALEYWVREAGIDGYRCDYVEGVPHDFWTSAISDLRAINPDLIMLAESANPAYYNDGFDMIYDWNSGSAISAAFTGGKPTDIIKEATDALAKVPDGKTILRFAFNHDTAAENSVDRMFGSAAAIPAAYVAASMLNGTPMIYSSMDAEGLTGKLSFFNYNPLTFSATLTAKYKAINDAFKKSGEVRRGQLGDYSNSSVLCFTREIPGHCLLVAVNTTGDTQTVRTPISLSGSSMTNLLDGSSASVPALLELGPNGYAIFMN